MQSSRLYIFFILLFCKQLFSQCPQVYDYLGNLSTRPYFVSCTGNSTYNVNFSSNMSWANYTIDWGDGSAISLGSSYIANGIINHTYNSLTPDTFEISLMIPSLSCTLTGIVVMEKPVNASIQIPISGVTTICAPNSLLFNNSSTDVSETTVFTWSFGDGTAIQTFNYTNVNQTISHLYQKGTVNCQTAVTLTAKNYCTSIPTIAQFNPIQIYDIDNANITPSAYIKCWPDNSFTFTNSTNRNCVPQGNTFQRQEKWNFLNYWGVGHDSIVGWKPWPPSAPITISYPNVGSYNVLLEDSNLCGINTKTITVTIVNPPNVEFIAQAPPLCQGAPVSFSNTSGPGYIYKWDFGTGGGFVIKPFGTQTYTYNTAGTYTVIIVAYVAGAGAACTDTAKTIITILPKPTVSFSVSATTGCSAIYGANFTDLSTGAVSWNWDFGNGNTFNGQNPPIQNYTYTGNYNASLLISDINTCTNLISVPISVYQKPIAQFIPTNSCVSSLVNFNDNSTSIATQTITNWQWNFGDASPTPTSSVQNPTHTYSAQNTYTVQLIVNTMYCGDTIEQVMQVNPKPLANFTFSPISGCPTLTVNFSNTSLGANTYTWNFDNGASAGSVNTSTLTNPTEVFTNTTTINKTYSVSLIAETTLGCKDNFLKTVTVFAIPKASFATNVPLGCAPIPATFSNTSTGASNFIWTFGDGATSTSSLAIVNHTFANASLILQTYTTQLVAISSNGCRDSSQISISTYPKPFFNFVMIPSSGCSPLSINFPPVLGAVSYTWNYGDGSPLDFTANPTHSFTNTTASDITYTVQLIATNAFSCIDTAYGVPVIFAKPTVNFIITPSVGCSPLITTFSNTSVAATTFNWKFGDNASSSATNTIHTYSASTNITYSCTLVATSNNGCKDSVSKIINVFALPKPNFIADTPSCSPKIISFTNTTVGAGNTYQWNLNGNIYSTTNVSQSFVNTTSVAVTNTVQLIAISVNNCKDTMNTFFITHPKPEFSVVASPDSGCTALTVNFPSIVGINSYQWQFGDGNISASSTASNIYYNNSQTAQTFTVHLIGTDVFGCKDTSDKVIKVFPKPVALFQANPNLVFVPNEAVQCNNLSVSASNYIWNFGDNSSSTEVNPSHSYNSPNEYQITLIAISNKGCKDTFKLPSKIIAVLESDIDVPNAFSPNTSGGNGGFFGVNDLNNDVFHPVIRGIEKYELQIFSRWGELLFVSKDVNIGWDGYYKGKLCTQDVYVWKINATTIDGKKLNKTGDVLLLK